MGNQSPHTPPPPPPKSPILVNSLLQDKSVKCSFANFCTDYLHLTFVLNNTYTASINIFYMIPLC